MVDVLTGHQVTPSERIAGVSLVAAAYGVVIHHLALGVLATGAWAGVLTLVAEARLGQRAVSTDHALWPAARWISNEARLAGAYRVIVHHLADAVCTARRWCAGLLSGFWESNESDEGLNSSNLKCLVNYCHRNGPTNGKLGTTESERIPSGARRAATHGDVIDHVAACTRPARAYARIHAVVIHASLHSTAVRVHGALWPTVRISIAEVIRQTCADTLVAVRVRPARGWVA